MYKYITDLWYGDVNKNIPNAPPLNIEEYLSKNIPVNNSININKIIQSKNKLKKTDNEKKYSLNDKIFQVTLDDIKSIKLKKADKKSYYKKTYSPEHPVLKEILKKVEKIM